MKKAVIVLFILLNSILLSQESLLNTSHLDYLYQQVKVNEDSIGYIYIYSEYPDYKLVMDDDEGIACVDDAARAMIFYLNFHKISGDYPALNKTRRLLDFIFYMQAENGFFYNFIWEDNSINKEFVTSEAVPNWWSWRALWALAEANSYFKNKDQPLYRKINDHLQKGILSLTSWLNKEEKYADFSGFNLPEYLPYGTASDQAAVILKALKTYFEVERDSSVIKVIQRLARGVQRMQFGSDTTPPYYAFLSWQNTWHAWGNSQADALLESGRLLADSTLINSALREIKYFYPYLLENGFISEFKVENENSSISFKNVEYFPQIAYGFRPMIFAAVNAFELTNDTLYAEIAVAIGSWFFSHNSGKKDMYNPVTGRCFDGLLENGKVNMNSGAESTIEALLSILKIESNPVTKNILHNRLAE
jgi:hypothetical protein